VCRPVAFAKKTSEPEAGHASRFLLFDDVCAKSPPKLGRGTLDTSFDSPGLQKASRYHQDAPGSAVSEDAADLTLKFSGAAAELGAEFAGERSQTSVADLETDISYAALRSQHLPSTIHAEASKKIMRRLAKRGTEEAMEMKLRKTGLVCRLLEQNPGLVFGGEEVTPATEPTESVIMEKLRHQEMILPIQSDRRRSAPCRFPALTRFASTRSLTGQNTLTRHAPFTFLKLLSYN
jgi:hypothetical protein